MNVGVPRLLLIRTSSHQTKRTPILDLLRHETLILFPASFHQLRPMQPRVGAARGHGPRAAGRSTAQPGGHRLCPSIQCQLYGGQSVHSANAEYATLGQGAVSAPFTTNVLDGTWVQLDFGTTVQFDRFVLRSRANNVDVIGESRLIVSADPVFDASDVIYTFNPTGANGAGPVRNLGGTATGRYVRWEVTTRTGSGLNLGGDQMWFLVVPTGHSLLPPPTVVGSSPPFNATYAAANAANSDYGIEYASLGAQGGMFIDFDFGAAKAITGFEFLNRLVDHVTTFNLVFADTPDFASPLDTKSFTASADGNFVNSGTFAPVSARYVRLQATGFAGADNTGVREIQFFTLAGQPPSITQVPTGGTRLAGDQFAFSAAAVGDNPLSFQWLHDGALVAGATGSSLVLSSLQVSATAAITRSWRPIPMGA